MHDYKVSKVQQLTPSVVLLTLQNRSGRDFSFAAGQYAALHFKNRGRPSPVRSFSIVSSPLESKTLQFAIRITGNYSYRLSQLQPGDSVFVQGPFGEFCFDERYDSSLVLIAGGIGITPFISILRYLAQINSPVPVRLLYSCRDDRDVPFAGELVKLQQQNPNLHVTFVLGSTISPEHGKADVFRGRIDEERIAGTVSAAPAGSTYFVCGPPSFMDSTTNSLSVAGVTADRMVTEAFGQRKLGGVKSPGVPARRIYATALLSIVLGTGIFAANSIFAAAHSAATKFVRQATSSDTDGSNTSGTSTSPGDTTSSQPSSTSSTTETPASSAPTTSTPSSTQTYQQPVSSVS